MSAERPGLAWVPVSGELLRQALHVPDDVEIVGCEGNGDGRTIRLLMRVPALDAGAYPIPEVTPVIHHQREEFRWEWPDA